MLKRVVSSLLQARRARGFAAFRRRCHDVRAAQEALLMRLMRNAHTALGRRLGAPAIRSLDDLRRLPISDYDSIQPELQAALAGRPDQLVAGRPGFFGMTSGTSGYAKYVPINDAYRAEFQSTVQHFLYGIVRDHPRALRHKALYLVAPAVLETTPGGEPAGAITGYNLRRLPALLRSFYAVPADAFEAPDHASQVYAVARFALASELSIAFAVTPAPLAILGQAIERDIEILLADIHDGTLARRQIPPALYASLTRGLRPDPARARALASRIRGRRATPQHLFPELAVIACWNHAGAGARIDALRDVWGDVPIRPAIYSATEGWMNIPLDDARPSGVLAADAAVLELIDGDGRAWFAHDVPGPGRYEILLTSGAGLWRYRLGDEVEVTGFFDCDGHDGHEGGPRPAGRAPELCFVQKTGNVLSLAHDMTTEAHVRAALAAALPRVTRWVFGPAATGDHYRIVVEGEVSAADAEALDAALARANMGYFDFRGDGQLRPLVLDGRGPEAFEAWEAARRGPTLAQAKPSVFVKTADELPS